MLQAIHALRQQSRKNDARSMAAHFDRIYSLALLLKDRLNKRSDSNGVEELLRFSEDVYQSIEDEYEEDDRKLDCLRRDVGMLCRLTNLCPCQLGTTP